ncbi:multiple sugar transport system permease protein [Ochrobactrum pecoris]|uniref:Multiple sugar transport system permease protein n=1 Tax=Brucella pecoris TaxID=867683 RepID=A0AB34YQ44_9HYPH|nr:multiple sugar transport system permease protein [Brucella pecoris]
MTTTIPLQDRRNFLQRLAHASEPYLYSAPALILIGAIMLVPLVLGISYAFRDIQLLNPFSGDFIGLEHFRTLADDSSFYDALKNTLWWTGGSVLLQFVFGLILALLLDKPFAGRGIAQALVFLPWAVPTFLSGLNWAWLFNPVIGPLPHWFYALGLMSEPNNILSDPNLAMWGMANWPFFTVSILRSKTVSSLSWSGPPAAESLRSCA